MSNKAAITQSSLTFGAAKSDSRLIIPLILVATTAVFSNMYLTQPILPVIGADFGLSPSQAGLTVSSMVLAIAAASIFYGLLSDRVGRKPVIVASVFALTLPTILCAI